MDDKRIEQYGKGEMNIDAAIREGLHRKGIRVKVAVGFTRSQQRSLDATVDVVVNGRRAALQFAYEDILDSCDRLTTEASEKVDYLIARISDAPLGG
jgi:hypothetical protein